MERIDDAKQAIRGARQAIDTYRELAIELGEMHVTPAQRDLFVSEIIGDKGQLLSLSASTSDRVKNNLDAERAKINALFMGQPSRRRMRSRVTVSGSRVASTSTICGTIAQRNPT